MRESQKHQGGKNQWIEYVPREAIGSEGGCILDDEEYKASCRITRERCERYDAITCGVYGDFVHTAFAGADESAEKYSQMKAELQEFIDADISDTGERSDFYESFCRKYW